MESVYRSIDREDPHFLALLFSLESELLGLCRRVKYFSSKSVDVGEKERREKT